MSHISKIEIQIKDIEVLKKACQRLGYTFVENKKSFVRYAGTTQCDHVIQVPGAKYEIGLSGSELLYDDFRTGGLTGNIPGKIKQAYASEQVKKEAKKKNYRIQEKHTQNGIKITLAA